MSFINCHMLSEEHFIINIVSQAGIMLLFLTCSQLLLLPLFFIVFLDFLAVFIETLSQSNAHSNWADELNKHDHTHLPIYTEVNCDSSSNKMEVERDHINIFPLINSLIH